MKSKDTDINIVGIIESYYSKETDDSRRLGVFHPSQLDICRRAIQFGIMNIPPIVKYPPFLRRIFDNGHYVEARLRKALMAKAKFEPTIKIKIPSLMIYGEADGIYFHVDDRKVVVDFKSINSGGFSKFKFSPKSSTGYVYQAMCYMKALKIFLFANIYENKDNQMLKQIMVPWNKKVWKGMVENIFDYILKATYKGKIVERDKGKCQSTKCYYYGPCNSNKNFKELDQRTDKQKGRLEKIAEKREY
jgi:hypothetical protein